MTDKLTDLELMYAATARCKCGAGLAHPLDTAKAMELRAWVCSKALKGETPKEFRDLHDSYPFAFYKIREETSINNDSGATTRPPGTVARTVGKAHCPNCEHKWESEPYSACGAGHHWDCGPCPKCGNDCGAGLTWSSDDKRPRIETRFSDVVIPEQSEHK